MNTRFYSGAEIALSDGVPNPPDLACAAKQNKSETMSAIRILSISDDDGLRLSRELLLLSDGYETESITSNTPLAAGFVRSFDIALICRSVKPERAIELTELMRKYHPEIQVACVTPLESIAATTEPDMEIASGPEAVLGAVRELCAQRSMRRAHYASSHSR